MFRNPHEAFEEYTCFFETIVGNRKQNFSLCAPRFMLERKFVSLVEQAIQNPSVPIMVKMGRMVPIWDGIQHKWIEIENYATFENKAWIAKEA